MSCIWIISISETILCSPQKSSISCVSAIPPIKEAETDAEKRALKTFGNQFGQALYDKTQSNVVDIIPTIDDAQHAELQVLIEQSGMTSTDFLTAYGIEKLGDLPEKNFAPAGKRLREIIHEKQQKEAA